MRIVLSGDLALSHDTDATDQDVRIEQGDYRVSLRMRDGYVRFDVTRTDKWKKAQNLPGREVQSTVFFE